MAKRVSGSLNEKPDSPENKLQKALDEMARDIALIEPHPQDWGWWASYLLEQLEGEAQRRGKNGDFEKMLIALIGDLTIRIDNEK